MRNFVMCHLKILQYYTFIYNIHYTQGWNKNLMAQNVNDNNNHKLCNESSINFKPYQLCIRSDQISRSVVSDFLQPHESKYARPPCPSPIPRVHTDSRPSSQ